MCDMDCFNCCKPDCDNDDLTAEERKAEDKRDRFALYDRKYGVERTLADYEKSDRGRERQNKYSKSEKGKQAAKRYKQSEKGKETSRRYNSSEEGKATQKRYLQSEKGKAKTKRINQKAVASGKNAEYCRAYYYRQKEKKLREMLGKEQ